MPCAHDDFRIRGVSYHLNGLEIKRLAWLNGISIPGHFDIIQPGGHDDILFDDH